VIETKSKEIGKHTYSVTPLTAKKAYKLLTKILKIVGPGVGTIVDGRSADGLVGQLIGQITERLDETAVEQIVDMLIAQTTVRMDGRDVPVEKIFDVHFVGKMSELMRVLAFALEVQYGDFFADLGGALGATAPVVAA
jgi:hypothetical protein